MRWLKVIEYMCSDDSRISSYLYDVLIKECNDPIGDRYLMNFCVNKMLNLQQQKFVTFDFPIRILWKITGRCNCNCRHCWADLGKTAGKTDLLRVANEIAQNNVFHVSISGGEPFLCNSLFDILKILKRRNILIEIMTNGVLLSKEVISKLKEILNLTTDVIQISLDGSTAAVHDMQRGTKVFDKTLYNIKCLTDSGFKVRIAYTATFINVGDILNTYHLVNSLNAVTFSISPVFPFRKGKGMLNTVDNSKYLHQIYLCKLLEPKMETKLRIQVNQFFQNVIYQNLKGNDLNIPSEKDLLYLPLETNSTVQIDAMGNLLPGPEWDITHSSGNVYEFGIKKLWLNGIKWNEFRKGRDLRKAKCSRCKMFFLCKGGNMKLAYEKYGTINMQDGSCQICIQKAAIVNS